MTAIRGAAAAVTGAASGIGRALALELAARGCDLALADRDEAGLQAVAAEIAQGERSAQGHDARVDVSEPGQIQDFAQAAIAAHPGLNIVINNAGVALIGNFNEIDQAQMDWLMNINFWGVVHGTRAFLPHLSSQREAHIVNLSSIFGIVAPPGQTAYCAAKFAVRGFSESLRHELQMANSPVQLSVVHPGGIATNIARNARTGTGITDNARRAESIERFDTVAQDHAAGRRAAHHRRHREQQPRILIGSDAKFIDVLQRLRPATYWKAIAGGSATSARDWEARKRRGGVRRLVNAGARRCALRSTDARLTRGAAADDIEIRALRAWIHTPRIAPRAPRHDERSRV